MLQSGSSVLGAWKHQSGDWNYILFSIKFFFIKIIEGIQVNNSVVANFNF